MFELFDQFSFLLWGIAFGLLASALWTWMTGGDPLIIFGVKHYIQMEISMGIVMCLAAIRMKAK